MCMFAELEDKNIICFDNDDYNYLFEGDNYNSLLYLKEKGYKEKINIIYIDPPYNTGNKDFIYNDNYSHTDWLEFMFKRLEIARNLLSQDGVIFISIDDHEFAQLKLLCDKLFGEDNFISNLVWRKHSGGKNDSKFLSNDIEYILCYAKDKSKLVFNKKSYDTDSTYKLKDSYIDVRGKYKLNKLDRGSIRYSKNLDYEIEAPDGSFVYAGGDYKKYLDRKSGKADSKDWCWRWSKEKVEWGIKNDYIVFKETKSGWSVYYKQYEFVDNCGKIKERLVPYSNYIDFVSSSYGKIELKNILGEVGFSYPKPSKLIKFLIDLYSDKNALVLDFFAGSGTTGQAVLELNKEDSGNRKFILCTSNENNICEDITYNRIKTVITGRRPDGSLYGNSFKSNLKYLRQI